MAWKLRAKIATSITWKQIYYSGNLDIHRMENSRH